MKRILFILFISCPLWLLAQTAQSVGAVAITVSDLEEAVRFYTEVLPFEEEARFALEGESIHRLLGIPDGETSIEVSRLRLGQERIELWAFSDGPEGRPIPADARSNDLWFQHIAMVVSDMDSAYRLLRHARVQHVSSMPQTLPDYLPAAAGIAAFYFRDPDGHNLELIYFPEGKGNPKWQEAPADLFLGIDHTAIGIAGTPESQAFYEELLGLKVAGGSENHGSEQEHLNMVFGAHLQITGLHAQAGPGVEFLEYLSPPGGRPFPADSRPWDLWHWHTHIQVQDLEAVHKQLRQAGLRILSEEVVPIEHDHLGFTQALMVRDPDGHAVLLTN